MSRVPRPDDAGNSGGTAKPRTSPELWVKIRHSLPDDPRVSAVAGRVDIDEDAALGKLLRMWVWASRYTRDGGVTCHATVTHLDRSVARCEGFCEAMEEVGWLEIDDAGITFPDFEKWNWQATQHQRRKEGATERKRRQRAKERDAEQKESSRPRHAHVTRDEGVTCHGRLDGDETEMKTPPPTPSGGGDRKAGGGVSQEEKDRNAKACAIVHEYAAVVEVGFRGTKEAIRSVEALLSQDVPEAALRLASETYAASVKEKLLPEKRLGPAGFFKDGAWKQYQNGPPKPKVDTSRLYVPTKLPERTPEQIAEAKAYLASRAGKNGTVPPVPVVPGETGVAS